MTWKLLILVVCLTASGLARPDVSHLFKKTGGGGGDKQKRQNFIETSVAVSGNGSAATVAEIRSNDAAVVEGPAVRIMLFPLEDNQPSPFRRLEDRTGYNYDKPDAPLDVHPDSNLVSPVSTQAPEYLPPEVGDETVNVDDIQLPSKPYPSSTTTTTTPGTTRTTTTRTTTTTTPVTTTTTSTTTGAPYTTNAIASTPQEFDGEEGYGYKKPEIMLPTNINEVIGEPIDINQLATTTEPTTTTTTPRASLEYLPPKPKPDLDAPKSPSTVEPFTETTTTGQPQSSTTYFFSIETSTQYPKLPEVVPSVYPDASGSVSSVVRPQPTTEVPSTSAPEYLPPDETAGFQIIVRTGSDDVEEATSDASTTVASTTVTQFTEPSTTVAPAAPEVDSLVRETSTVQQELEQTFTTTTTTTTTTTPEEPSTTVAAASTSAPNYSTTVIIQETPQEDTSSMVSLINQLQEMLQIAAQAEGFAPEVRFNEEEETATSTSVAPSTSYTTITASSTVTTVQPTTAVTEPSSTEIPTTEPSETPSPPLESRISPDEPSGPSLIDLLSPAITTMLGSTTANDTITTYRPQVGISDAIQPTTTKAIPGPEVQESNADETEVQPRIADPNDGYNYQTPDNSFTVPTMMVAPSHTLEADGYHYKVPSVPFP